MGSRSHPHRVLSVCVCVCVSRCLWVCVIEADSLQLRVITVGLYLFLSRSLLCQILAVFAVVVYGPFWFRDSWALLLPGLRSPDLGCPLLPCATRLSPTESSASAYGKLRLSPTESSASAYGKLRLSPTESSASAYGKLRFCLRKLRLCPTESSASAYRSSAFVLRKAPFSFSLCITSVINSFSATESSRLHCDTDTFMVITFAGALRQALVYCVRLNAEPFSCADSKHRRAALSRGSTDSCFSTRVAIFFHY